MNKFETDVLKVVEFVPHEIGNLFDFLKKNGATIQTEVATGQTILGDVGKVAGVLGESPEVATALKDASIALGGISTAVASAQTADDLTAQVAVAEQVANTVGQIAVKNPVSQAALTAGENQATQIAGILQAAVTTLQTPAQAAS
jgi:hypothetical protein